MFLASKETLIVECTYSYPCSLNEGIEIVIKCNLQPGESNSNSLESELVLAREGRGGKLDFRCMTNLSSRCLLPPNRLEDDTIQISTKRHYLAPSNMDTDAT